MNKLMDLIEKSRAWLGSDPIGRLLAEPSEPMGYDEHDGARVVVLAIDVSPSMEECDYYPTRLEGAKRAVRRYLDTLRARHR